MTNKNGSDISRREILRATGIGSGMFLAGCSGQDQSKSTPTTISSRTTKSTTSESPTTTDETAPSFNSLEFNVDEPQTTSSRKISVSGTVADDNVVARVEFTIGGETFQTTIDAERDDFTIHGHVHGGEKFTAELTAIDIAGNTSTVEREFGYIAKPTEPIPQDRLVGIHYYSWWNSGWHWPKGYDGTPVLGEYNSRDPAVIRQHLEWLRNAGVNWLSLSWYGIDSWSDTTLREAVLPHDDLPDFHISVLYESNNLLHQGDTWLTDFDKSDNRDQLVSDIEFLASEYFNHPRYLRFDGRPVLYLYNSSGFIGDFPAAIERAEQRIGEELYLIGDFSFQKWGPEQRFYADVFDAVSNYSAFYQPWENINEITPDQLKRQFIEWRIGAERAGFDLIPTLSQGFDKTSHEDPESKDLPILHCTPEKFADWCESTIGTMDKSLNAVLLTSFNEWHEGTQLEPSEEHGTAYLDVVREKVANSEALYVNTDTFGMLTLKFDRTIAEQEVNHNAIRNRDLALFVDQFELQNEESGWQKNYDVGTGLKHPHFVEGVYKGPSNPTRRWFGGRNAQAVLGFDRDLLSKAQTFRIRANAQWQLPRVGVQLQLDDKSTERQYVEPGDPQWYSFDIPSL